MPGRLLKGIVMNGAILVLMLQAWLVPADGTAPFIGGTMKYGLPLVDMATCEQVKSKGADIAAGFLAPAVEKMWHATVAMVDPANPPEVLLVRKQWCEPESEAWAPK